MNWENDDGSIEWMVRKHEQDLYRGNGKPGMTTRINDLERDMEAIKENRKTRDAQIWAIILMVLGLIASAVWNDFIRPVAPQSTQRSYID